MVKYEMGVVVRADLPEDGHTVELDKVKALIDRFGGTIDKIDEWGRRRLAYPIAKQTEGIYTFITYTADPSAPKEIESRTRLIENVLRFLTVRKDEVEEVAIAPPEEDNPLAEPPIEPVAEDAVVDVIPVEEVPVEEEPVVEEAPAEEEPVVEEVPAAEEPPVEEVPAVEEPAVEETPAKEAPAVEESVAEEAPAAEELPTEEAQDE